jgi:hypothetical protein
MSELLPADAAPNHITVWAWVEADDGECFWKLAERYGDEWVGVTAWSDYQIYEDFRDYGWTVLGWRQLERPEEPTKADP